MFAGRMCLYFSVRARAFLSSLKKRRNLVILTLTSAQTRDKTSTQDAPRGDGGDDDKIMHKKHTHYDYSFSFSSSSHPRNLGEQISEGEVF